MDNKTNHRLMRLLLFLCFFLKTRISLGANTISANQSLSGDQTIVSADGRYVLGFSNPGNSSNYYIGIWNKKDPLRIILWEANGEKPVSDRFSSELRISEGNLVLFNESRVPIWSTNIGSTSSPFSVHAVLLKNGNLVLNDGSNSSKPLWQSFDHPTHSWFYDLKVGYNKLTKTKTALTSWKNSENPAPGLFSFEITPSYNSFIMVWNGTKTYWSTGIWNRESFSLLPEVLAGDFCFFRFVLNENEIYLTHHPCGDKATFLMSWRPTTFLLTRTVMDVSGQIQQFVLFPNNGWELIWSFPKQQCQVYALCGAYGSCNENSLPFCHCLMGFKPKSQSDWDLRDYSGGCLRKTRLQCDDNTRANGERDRFLEMTSMRLPENEGHARARSVEECESSCLINCLCTAYAFYNNGCTIWTEDLFNLQQLTPGDSSGKTLHIRLATSEFQTPKKSKRPIIVFVVSSTAAGVVFLTLISFLTLRQRMNKVGIGKTMEGSLVAFGYKDLKSATKNFSEKLGGGGFGSVFKGLLPDSTVFRTEVNTIGSIQHVNLVRLRGFCSEGTKKLLVYDHMSNGSLDSNLFRQNVSNVLDWKTRYQIVLGIARGLVYLHERCRECIIHCDIKPDNILLDSEFCPKVADFGLAKLVGREFSRVLTSIRGTRGYLAPEWIAGVAITSKTDQCNDERVEFFPTWAATITVEGGDVLGLLDKRLEGNCDIEEVERICKVACWCIQDDEAHRPSMSQVVQMLEGFIDVKLPPFPGSLHFFAESEENVIFSTVSYLSRVSSRDVGRNEKTTM
ncbi:hypothetical protein UlMin_014316 [Ulmus minor]